MTVLFRSWHVAELLLERKARPVDVLVWWPPTSEQKKTEFGGRWWLAKVIGVTPHLIVGGCIHILVSSCTLFAGCPDEVFSLPPSSLV